jgi:hypothetical protein
MNAHPSRQIGERDERRTKKMKKPFQKTRITWGFRPVERIKKSAKAYVRKAKHRGVES